MSNIITEDLRQFRSDFKYREKLENSVFLITGITGLIGSNLVRCLLSLNSNIKIYAPVRDASKVKDLLEYSKSNLILFEVHDLMDFDFDLLDDVDYVAHCAAPTASKYFITNPVETINSIVSLTDKLLRYAMHHQLKGFVYLSSIEVYGQINSDKKLSENEQAYINTLDIRSSYPLAKRLAENLCCSYASEYDVPACIVRLTQTTGPGISNNDNRVIAQFTRAAVRGEDIVLHTLGESARPYCYTIDAVEAILYVLLFGVKGEAYNVAHDESYISARDLALLIKRVLNPAIEVRYEIDDNMGYAPASRIDLSIEAIKKLGWAPKYTIEDIIINLSKYLKENDI